MIDYKKLYSRYDKEDLINTVVNLKEYKERLRKEVNKSYIVCDEKDKKIKELNKRINYAEVMINGALAEFGSFDEFWEFLVELREVLTEGDNNDSNE